MYKHIVSTLLFLTCALAYGQKLNYQNITAILSFKNEFDLNEFLDSKGFIYSKNDLSDTTTSIKTYMLGAVNSDEAEEAIVCYYDLSDKLAKVEYVIGGLSKSNTFRRTYSNIGFVRKYAWVKGQISHAIYYNSLYTLHYMSYKNDINPTANTYRFGFTKRYGAFDRRDGFVEYYHKLGDGRFGMVGNREEAYYKFLYKNFNQVGYSNEWCTDDGKVYLRESHYNKFGEVDTMYSIFQNNELIRHKSCMADLNSSPLKYLLKEKVCTGRYKGELVSSGYIQNNIGELQIFFEFDSITNDYVKIIEKVGLINIVDDYSSTLLRNGEYSYKSDKISIIGQYDKGEKSGIWKYYNANGILTKKEDYSTVGNGI